MKYAIISDLHIGNQLPIHILHDYISFFDFLEATHDEIILLGDIFETLFPVFPWGANKQLELINNNNLLLTSRFWRYPYSIIYGNHDRILNRLHGYPDSIERNNDGMCIFFSHGHRIETIFQSLARTRIAEFYMWLSFRLKKIGFPCLYNLGYKYDYTKNMSHGGQHQIEYARSIIQEFKYDVVILGHTHIEQHIRFSNGGEYINCGDCCNRKIFASIDTNKKICGLFTFDNDMIVQIDPEIL